MPLGTPLQSFIYDIGEALHRPPRESRADRRTLGGCIPVEMFETPVDYENLAQIAPSWVPAAWSSWTKTTAWSMLPATSSNHALRVLRQMVPCRVGLNKALRILNAVTTGRGTSEHLNLLDELGRMIRDCSLCALGQSAPNPVLPPSAISATNTRTTLSRTAVAPGVCQGTRSLALRKQLSAAQ